MAHASTPHDNELFAAMYFPHYLFYTTTQFEKIHRQFAHPPASKLFNLLERAGTEAVDVRIFKRIYDIVARCESCQHIHKAPERFHVSILYENSRFNDRAYINIMYLDDKPYLHIVYEATLSSAALFRLKFSKDAVLESVV